MEKVYANRENLCVLEEKFQLVKDSSNVYKGKYPLEPYQDGARGTYGGELITQSILAIWKTIEDPSFSPHSLHSYFLKAGSSESSMRYEVETNSQGKNYINKSVKVFQEHNNELVFILSCSFTRNNSIHNRKVQYAKGETKRIPFEFGKPANDLLYQYKGERLNELDGLLYFEHTHELVAHALPNTYVEVDREEVAKTPLGAREIGFFVKVVDSLPTDPQAALKTKISGLLYLSDSLYLGSIARTLGLPLSMDSIDFFRVSLDHSVFIHDNDFDPTQWLFCDYKFNRMSNERILCLVSFYDIDGKLIATVTQEALINLEKGIVDRAIGGSYKL